VPAVSRSLENLFNIEQDRTIRFIVKIYFYVFCIFLSFAKIRLHCLPCAALKSVRQYQTTLFFSVTLRSSNKPGQTPELPMSIFDYIPKTKIPKSDRFRPKHRTYFIRNTLSPAHPGRSRIAFALSSALSTPGASDLAAPADSPAALDFVKLFALCGFFGCALQPKSFSPALFSFDTLCHFINLLKYLFLQRSYIAMLSLLGPLRCCRR